MNIILCKKLYNSILKNSDNLYDLEKSIFLKIDFTIIYFFLDHAFLQMFF